MLCYVLFLFHNASDFEKAFKLLATLPVVKSRCPSVEPLAMRASGFESLVYAYWFWCLFLAFLGLLHLAYTSLSLSLLFRCIILEQQSFFLMA